MSIYAASTGAIPMGIEWINSAFSNNSERFNAQAKEVLFWGPVLVIGLGGVNALAQYTQSRLNLGAALSVLKDLQTAMFARLMCLDYAQVRADASGQIISRFTNDALVLRETLTRAANAIRDVLTLAGLCAIMIYYDWALFLVVLIVYPLIGWPVARIGKYLRRTSARAQDQAGDVTSLISETVTGARMIKTYGLEMNERARADASFEKRLSLLKKIAYMRALNEPFIFFVGSIALGVVVAVVALRVMAGAIDGPQFIAFIVALLLLSQPARGLGTLNAVAQEGFAAFERMLALIDAEPRIVDRLGANPLKINAGEISFRDVQFSYEQGVAALNGFSLNVPAGAMVAIVGESGAGKTTVFNLLPRLYEADSGEILVDGQNILETTLASLRDAIAVVSQDAILFNDTVRANIAFGQMRAGDSDIVEAAKAAVADEFIRALPEGYDTIVGEGGANLSGGQRQRIALARAFLKDAPILLLDEATSALDVESEVKVQAALSRLQKGRTTLVIAHRLSTVKNADLIVVMDKGRVIEQGSHDALTAQGGVYSRLALLQLQTPAR